MHNTDFKGIEFDAFKMEAGSNTFSMSPTKWINGVDAKGIISKRGRYGGGTYAHHEIALEFCTWLSPEFKVYFYKEWIQLKTKEYSRKNLEFHVKRITDSIEEARNWLDTIPGQEPNRNRIRGAEKE